ncbi:L-threonylcarbamoyladenylate synthase [Pediococcus claussenii]|uniref:Threonylcarbamoyl-AMP synthase n=1 Tax=Pediococcus claussenii (strain ATCC BAA-344 / DSM 14800 / JCM 18046 / KCTC 3811 / LMG 21948 / P06) TaxID=701521 RepID=G8PCG5_PEDCP|nr:L-threonylcarbamoyladenylate synthase [Pediococcus claussenii]AEV94950.1 hypothetical protein PECL_658 [Pediococcus claussenii ATCC BAA-344]ANZ70140.1 translation factor Sua5 [Pediococcus claussenii]ANZ71956.1 translation factor Sua5 [Pediococcus claussenii]KRN19247.1 hypothetical protein IV79_GL001619 [Pediococcus claussenii]
MSKLYTKQDIKEAAKAIKEGKLVAFPTETVYGLGADATNVQAVNQVFEAKGRPSDNPLIVHVADIKTVEELAEINKNAYNLMKRFWPGPLTIILPIKPGSLDKVVTGGLTTAAFRNPDNKETIDLIKAAGVPLVGPSANTSGKPSPTKPEHVLHDLDGKIAGVLDDGETRIGVESTVIDVSTKIPAILRPGAVTVEQIESVIGEIQTDHHKVGKNETPKAPGMKYKHYAPNAQVYIVGSDEWLKVKEWILKHPDQQFGIMAPDKLQSDFEQSNVSYFGMGNSIQDASHRLFDGLRLLDGNNKIKIIFAPEFVKIGLGIAYMNRLEKSAGKQYLVDLVD